MKKRKKTASKPAKKATIKRPNTFGKTIQTETGNIYQLYPHATVRNEAELLNHLMHKENVRYTVLRKNNTVKWIIDQAKEQAKEHGLKVTKDRLNDTMDAYDFTFYELDEKVLLDSFNEIIKMAEADETMRPKNTIFPYLGGLDGENQTIYFKIWLMFVEGVEYYIIEVY